MTTPEEKTKAEQLAERAELAPREPLEMPYLRAIPQPTPWPILAAFALVGIIGWFR